MNKRVILMSLCVAVHRIVSGNCGVRKFHTTATSAAVPGFLGEKRFRLLYSDRFVMCQALKYPQLRILQPNLESY